MLLLFILTVSLKGELKSIKSALIIFTKLDAAGFQSLMEAQTVPSMTLVIVKETKKILREIHLRVWSINGMTFRDLIVNPFISRRCHR